jgi:hypothetical protein
LINFAPLLYILFDTIGLGVLPWLVLKKVFLLAYIHIIAFRDYDSLFWGVIRDILCNEPVIF